MAEQRRIFLSAVSAFAPARDALADALRANEQVIVKNQPSFSADLAADSLLHQLARYIESCDLVVCLIGDRSGGGFPKPDEAAPFLGKNILPDGITEASYTQWEYYLARHSRRHCLVYRATDAFTPAGPPSQEDRPALQAAFVAHVRTGGQRIPTVASAADFKAEVLKDIWINWPIIAAAIGVPQPDDKPDDKPTVLPYGSLGTLFKGRDDFLATLHRTLHQPGGTAAITSNAVHGIGGIGKTRAAVEYAWAHRATYSALLFVQADSPDNLTSNLAALAAPLRLPEAAATETDARLHAVLAWLRGHRGWLLILDNSDSEPARDAVLSLLGQLSGGAVLVTSRLAAGSWESVPPVELDVLAADAAAAYLDEATAGRLHRPDDDAAAHDLAHDLGGLALALALAAATIRERQCSFADYRGLWDSARDKVRGWNKPAVTGYHSAVGQTWQASVALVSDDARVLLERLAFLAPDPVPGALLDVAVPADRGRWARLLNLLRGALRRRPKGGAREALLELARFSLVTRQPAADRFTVHRLVQDATRRGLDAATAPLRLAEALRWLDAAWVGDAQDARTWPLLEPLAPHAEAVATQADRVGVAGPIVRVMHETARLFAAKAQYQRAEPLMRRSLAIAEASRGADHPDVAVYLNNLASLLHDTNRLGEAEPLYRRVVTIFGASLGADHPNVATALNNLAGLLRATNRLDEAEPLFRRVVTIFEADLGAAHPNVATALNNLAALLRATNRLGEAEPLFRRALAIDEAGLGVDHPNVARDLNNLALLLRATNRLGEAEPLYRRAVAISEASLGANHPTVATRLNNLALLLQATNRLDEAEQLMRRALGIDEAGLGADHPNVAIRLNNLALLLHATNRLGEAEPLMRRHLVIFLAFQRDTGHVHPDRDAAIRNYAGLLHAMGRDDAAIHASIDSAHREAGLG